MASLKEIRGRIGSVKQTLKITSAMRLISSAKLRSAQNAMANMVAYEEALKSIFGKLSRCGGASSAAAPFMTGPDAGTSVVLVTSNQSLCGGFNAGLVRAFANERFDVRGTKVYAIGKFGMKAVRDMGYDTVDLCRMAEKADFDASSSLAGELVSSFLEGRAGRVVVIYAHFASASSQPVRVEDFLPLGRFEGNDGDGLCETDLIVEPSPSEFLELMLPKVLGLSLHTMLMDAGAAEHAARTMAMQMASDNADDLLSELSLQYNKLRQQAITNELLDLLGGQTSTNR